MTRANGAGPGVVSDGRLNDSDRRTMAATDAFGALQRGRAIVHELPQSRSHDSIREDARRLVQAAEDVLSGLAVLEEDEG